MGSGLAGVRAGRDNDVKCLHAQLADWLLRSEADDNADAARGAGARSTEIGEEVARLLREEVSAPLPRKDTARAEASSEKKNAFLFGLLSHALHGVKMFLLGVVVSRAQHTTAERDDSQRYLSSDRPREARRRLEWIVALRRAMLRLRRRGRRLRTRRPRAPVVVRRRDDGGRRRRGGGDDGGWERGRRRRERRRGGRCFVTVVLLLDEEQEPDAPAPRAAQRREAKAAGAAASRR